MCSKPLQPLFSHLTFDEVLCQGNEEDVEETLAPIFGRMSAKKVSFTQQVTMEVIGRITGFIHA